MALDIGRPHIHYCYAIPKPPIQFLFASMKMKPVPRVRNLCRLLMPLILFSSPALADDFIWAGSGQSEDWGDSSNWLILSGNVASSTSSTPGSNDNFEAEVLLNDSFHLDLDGNRSIRDIDVEMFGGTVAQIGQSVGDYTLTLERKLEVDRLTFSGASNSDRTTLTIYSDLRPTWNTNATTFLGSIGLGEKQTAIIEGAIITDPPTVTGVFDQAADFITLRGTSSSDSNASIYKIPGDKAQMQRCISLLAAQLIAETGDNYTSTNLRVSNLGTFIVNAPTSLGYLASATADFPKLTLNADLSFGGNGYDALSDLEVSGTGNLTKSGGGTHSFQGEFDGWSGNFTASEGTLELSTGGTFPSTSELKIEGNGSLTLKEAESIGGLFGSGSLTLEAALSLGGGNASETFSGSLSGSSNVTKVGTGSQLFSGDHSSFSGAYQVDAGTLEISGSADLGGSSSVSIASGATFIGKSADSVAGVSGAGTLDLQNHLSIGTGNNTSTFSGSMTGNGDFTMNDNGGTFTFSGDRSTHTGNLTVSAGELILEVDSALSSTHNFSLPANATMTFATGVYQRMAALSGAGTLEVNGHLEFGSDSTVSALDGALMGVGQFTKVGNLNLNLNANNSFNGVATILGGTVTVGSSGNGFLNTGSVYIDDGAIYDVDNLMGSYEVRNGSTIGGDGRVIGDMSLKFDAMLAPGMQNAIGALTTDNITMQGNSVLEWEISDWTGSATEGWDQLICDDLTIDSGANWIVRIIPNSLVNATEEDRTFEIVRADNLINFSPSTVTIDDNRWSGSGTWSVVEGTGSNLLLIYDVPDTTAPVITLNGSTPVTVECGSTYTDAGATAFDVSDNTATAVTVVITDSSQTTLASVDTSTTGSYTITYSSTDSESNTGTINRVVNVVDTTAPTVTITGGNSAIHEWGQTFTAPGSTVSDNCDSSLTASVFGDAAVNDGTGAYAVTYTATDSAGNVGTATLTVTTVDTTKPVLTLNGDATVYVELGLESYTESGAAVVDVESGLVVDVDDNDVNNTEAGTYTVTYDVTDSSGNEATQITRTVVVRDTIDPVISLVGDDPLYLECGLETYRDPGTTIVDTGTPSLVAAVGGDTVDASTLGTYVVTYNAIDLAGNSAVQITRTVIVRDTTAPAILITGGTTISLGLNDTYFEQGATAIDACDGTTAYANFTSTVSTVNTSAYGTYFVTYTVEDSSGNEASSSRTVLVTHSSLDWTGTTDTQWRTLTNWGSASQYPGSVTDVNLYGTATRFEVDLGSNGEACKNLLIDSATSYTIQNGILSVSGGSLEIDQGAHTISTLLDLSASTTVDVASGTNLTNSFGVFSQDSIDKVGTGTWNISGDFGWFNDLDVSAGEIEFGSALTIAPGMNLTIDSGAVLDFSNVLTTAELVGLTLSGEGTIQGDISLGTDVTVKPGSNDVGTLATGGLSFLDGVTYDWELADWAGSAGSGWDVINSTGTVQIASSSAMPMTIEITETSLQNFIEQDANFAVIAASAVNGFDSSLISIDDTGFTSGNGTWSVSLENNTIYLNYNSPVVAGDPVTVQGVTVAGVASLTEGDFTGGTVTVSVSSPLPTEKPLTATLSFDDTQLQVSINAAHAGDNFISIEPGTGDIIVMFFNDPFLGESSQLSYTLDVVAVDDAEVEGNQTATIAVSVTTFVDNPPDPPMLTITTDYYGIEIIDDDSYYKIWASMNGLFEGVNDGLTQDPNSDGKTNLEHFATGSSPLGNSGVSGLQKQTVVDVDGTEYYTITLPVRAGASFSGTPLSADNIDGITYAFRANSDLSSNSDITVTEFTPADTAGLDSVPSGYEYKTFGIPISSDRGFMQIEITSSP